MERKREILITNDDGFNAKGINILAELMMEYGNVTVVAPTYMQSGKSAALSLQTPLYLKEEVVKEGLKIYSFGGTPVDCVKMGINKFFQDRYPDLLVSGINHGSNASVASLYSGTLGGCIEGTIYGIPSIGFSIDSHSESPDFEVVIHYGRIILDKFLAHKPSPYVYLNVNFPNLPKEEIKGIKMARRGYGKWIKEYTIQKDENDNEYYWMSGIFENLEKEEELGDHLLNKSGYITIVPHKIDTTDYEEIERLKRQWDL